MSISRLLWSGRWKLQGEIQRHAIVITYMFMTNYRCEDSFVQISRLQHVLNDIQKQRQARRDFYIFKKIEYFNQLGGQFRFKNRYTFGEIQINVFPVLPDNKNDRNCTEINNLLVCSHSLPGKIKCIEVKANDVTMYGRSANL